MRLHFGNRKTIPRIADSVHLYPAKEFKSPTRSTIPLLSMMIHDFETFRRIAFSLDMPKCCDLHLEYRVRPLLGLGGASHTDVMLVSSSESLAIEAKWTEPMYPTVENWFEQGKHRLNRDMVLSGWLAQLQAATPTPLMAEDFDPVINQMLHRAASAAAAGKNPRLAYFIFKPSPDDQAAPSSEIFEKLKLLWVILGKPENFPFYSVEISLNSLDAYEPLRLLPKNDEATAKAVIAALLSSSPLFRFEKIRCRKVGAEP